MIDVKDNNEIKKKIDNKQIYHPNVPKNKHADKMNRHGGKKVLGKGKNFYTSRKP